MSPITDLRGTTFQCLLFAPSEVWSRYVFIDHMITCLWPNSLDSDARLLLLPHLAAPNTVPMLQTNLILISIKKTNFILIV
jgi:hypothetical protein